MPGFSSMIQFGNAVETAATEMCNILRKYHTASGFWFLDEDMRRGSEVMNELLLLCQRYAQLYIYIGS